MKRDFNTVARSFDGSPIEQPVYKTDPKTGCHMTNEKGELVFEKIVAKRLKQYVFDLLGGRLRGDDNISGAELMARYSLAAKIAAAGDGPTDIEADDVNTLTSVLEKGASPLIYGQIKKILDTDPEEAK